MIQQTEPATLYSRLDTRRHPKQTMTTSTFSDLGTQAIAGPDAAGTDVRNDPDFEAIEAEIAKLSSLSSSNLVDWALVARLATDMLTSKSKDLSLACFLSAALLETRALPGLADGLQTVAGLLETYWETLFPPLKRIRARRNSLEWLVERVVKRADETGWTALGPQSPELIATLMSSLQAIDKALLEKDSEAPSIRPIMSLVKSLAVVDVPDAAAIAKASDKAQGSNAAHASLASTSPAAPDSAEMADKALDKACADLAGIASWLLQANIADPLPYRLNRLAVWTPLNALPPASAEKTLFPAPISQVVDALARLTSSQSDADIVAFAESQLAAFPLWLDLNCVCATALERLGGEHLAASREVSGETARLIERLPNLLHFSFASGMPFADSATQAWLQSWQSPGSANPTPTSQGGKAGSKSNSRDALKTLVGKAFALASSDNLAGGIASLQSRIDEGGSASDQLFLKIRLCELLLQERPGAALEAFALPLVECIDRFKLEQWEPALALDGLQLAYRVLSRDDAANPAAVQLLQRIAALDASAAFKLVG